MHLYEEQRWNAMASARTVDDSQLQEGLTAYGLRQASIRRNMRATVRALCLPIVQPLQGQPLGQEWAAVEGAALMDDTEYETWEVTETDAVYELDGEDLEPTPRG